MDTDDKTANARTKRHLARWASVMDRLAQGPASYGPHDTEQVCAALERLCDERDRLRRVLAVERGDEAQAPPEWKAGAAGWCVYGSDGQAVREVERAETDGPWTWFIYESIGDGLVISSGYADTALEAMEAADKASKAATDAP